jgi:glutamate-1-semialdehyde 2,1-aminomutase
MKQKGSAALFERAANVMPGGVSSPVRAFAPNPIFFGRGEGSHLWDVDGNRYLDLNMAFGPLILGHAHDAIVAALQEQAALGTIYGAPTELEVRYAELISGIYPGMEKVRFVSSGTEATMHAVRLARGATGRSVIFKTEGAFHGSHDAVLVKAGSGAMTHGAPNSLGVPAEAAANTAIVPFNDLHAMETAVRVHRGRVAAVIVEPMIGNMGPILPAEGYLQGLRELCDRCGALLIFDEVITGFRLALGGAQERFRVRADITVLGKVAGGGMPFGAYGASKEIMDLVSPTGGVYQAGTYSGNPMSIRAGMETVRILRSIGYQDLEEKGELIRSLLSKGIAEAGLPARVQGLGSLFQVFFGRHEVTDGASALRCDAGAYMRMFRSLLDNGIYLPPSQFETCFLSTAHSRPEIEEAAAKIVSAMQEAAQ